MNSKANLKAAREAIGAKNFDEAVKACKRVLVWEGANYNAWVFLGVAYTGLNDDEEAENSYRRAIEIDPDNMLAWQGLVSFYEKRERLDDMAKIVNDLLPRAAESGDGNRVVDYLNKLVRVYENKDEEKYIATLKLFLPSSQYYDLIKDTKSMRSPLDIWTIITNITEANQAKLIEDRVQSRRLGVHGGPAEEIRAQVEAEVNAKTQLGNMYETLLQLSKDNGASTETIQDFELKLLNYWYKRIPAIQDKKESYTNALQLADSLVKAGVNDPLPWQVLINTTDAKDIDQYDSQLLDDLVTRFPNTGLTKLVRGYKLYKENDIDQAFDLFAEGMDECPSSLFGYQCLCWIYYNSKEYETGLEYATKGRDLVLKRAKDMGIMQEKILDSMELCMAHCYRHLDTKYYPDAMGFYRKILGREPDEMSALEGVGLILREGGQYDEALSYFKRVHELDPKRHIALAEIGWIHCQQHDYDKAIECTTQAIELAEEDIPEYYYRMGRIYWEMGGEYREDTSYAFKYFMRAVKLDHEFASGFAYLGHFYREVQNDAVRAKKLYQKTFLLDPLQVDAAFHLSNYYVEDDEHEEAEAVFRQVTQLVPRLGWAWRRLGYANINNNQYDEAITCFQKALRCDARDLRCWEGLAEAYAHEGRFIAALKAFGRATDLDPSSVHANFEKSLVKKNIGLLDEAIAGFKETLQLAEAQGKPNYLPAVKGLADTHLEQAKEELQQGFLGRAAESCAQTIRLSLTGIQQDSAIVGFWKLLGDACSVYRIIPTNIQLCPYNELQQVIGLLSESAPHEKLGFQPDDPCADLVKDFVQLDVTDPEFYLPPKTALSVVLACATFVYKQALVVCKNHPAIAPALWHDLAMLYHWMAENNHLDGKPTPILTDTAMHCIRVALKMEPAQPLYWNALGVIAIRGSPKTSQYALVKAIELNSRSAVPWTNYGFLCLAQQDYELANQAFDMAHALDPEYISAWVGQAYVASLWGTSDAGAVFQHAFESSNGTAYDASYGYAEATFSRLSTLPRFDTSGVNLLISPTFALQKLTEQRLDDAQALNLLGLLLERLGHYDRAVEALASAVLALEAQAEEGRIADENVLKQRMAMVHANLGRTLCASGNFSDAITHYENALEHGGSGSSRVYCLLGAGIAYYFEDKLQESLEMFETALNETESDVDLRMDVTVLLSKVLWALGGDEQRDVAKNQMLSSIADDPNYLPAIFALCVMGILQNDETLTQAALEELRKVPAETAYQADKDQKISWLLSRLYQLQHDPEQAIRSLVKGVHQLPWMAILWSRLASSALLNRDTSCATTMTSTALKMVTASTGVTADAKAEAYENDAQTCLTIDPIKAKRQAQRALLLAPWRSSAWKTVAQSVTTTAVESS